MKNEVNLSIWMRANYRITERNRIILPTICGVGINDADYEIRTKIDRKLVVDPAYKKWKAMIRRCYSKYKSSGVYKDVIVDDQWHSFMAFRAWFIVNYQDGYSLDKDILTDSRIYSPKSCLFVPLWVNNMAGDQRADKSLPIGAHITRDKFGSEIVCDGVYQYIGLFDTAEEAHDAWLKIKLEYLLSRKIELDAIDIRLYPRLVSIIQMK